MDRLGDTSLRDVWGLARRWWPLPAIVGVALWLIIGGSHFGFAANKVFGGVVLALMSAAAAIMSFDSVRRRPPAFRDAILGGALVAAFLGAVVSIQTQCTEESRGSEPECIESEGLPRAEARANTESGLVVFLGLSLATLAGAAFGRIDRDSV